MKYRKQGNSKIRGGLYTLIRMEQQNATVFQFEVYLLGAPTSHNKNSTKIYRTSFYNTTMSIPPHPTVVRNQQPKNVNVAPPPPAIVPAGTSQEKPVVVDPLGEARSKVQEEIGKEFAAMMSSGTLCASEAVALATKKEMQKYGHINAAQS
ncbi:unnamed protein product [Lactuca virosa]|uniref:Uncharacterized protein n=1 Tax=Lactuca virosa TaxID=75947 RepID=A0AAU9LQ46_9ASTR|nr:unnamed protein product [Lactuca virosa]